MDEENLVRDEVTVLLDLRARRDVLVAHHQVGRAAILPIDLDDEWSLAGVTANASLSLAALQDQSLRLHRWRRETNGWRMDDNRTLASLKGVFG